VEVIRIKLASWYL